MTHGHCRLVSQMYGPELHTWLTRRTGLAWFAWLVCGHTVLFCICTRLSQRPCKLNNPSKASLRGNEFYVKQTNQTICSSSSSRRQYNFKLKQTLPQNNGNTSPRSFELTLISCSNMKDSFGNRLSLRCHDMTRSQRILDIYVLYLTHLCVKYYFVWHTKSGNFLTWYDLRSIDIVLEGSAQSAIWHTSIGIV